MEKIIMKGDTVPDWATPYDEFLRLGKRLMRTSSKKIYLKQKTFAPFSIPQVAREHPKGSCIPITP